MPGMGLAIAGLMRASTFASSAVAVLIALVGACANEVNQSDAPAGGDDDDGIQPNDPDGATGPCPPDPSVTFECATAGLECTYYREDGCPEVYACTESYDGSVFWDYFDLQPTTGMACDTAGQSCTYFAWECYLNNVPPVVATCEGGQWNVEVDATTCEEVTIVEGDDCLGCGMPEECPHTVQTELGEVEMLAVCEGNAGWKLTSTCGSNDEAACGATPGCTWVVPCDDPGGSTPEPACIGAPLAQTCSELTCGEDETCVEDVLVGGDVGSGDCSTESMPIAWCVW